MQLKHLLTAILLSSVLAPAAMAKSAGGLRIKNVPVKMRAAGKSKVDKKKPAQASEKPGRKAGKRAPKPASKI